MVAEKPTLVPAIRAVSEYEEAIRANLSPEHVQVLIEIRRRLQRLEAQAAELIDINNRMWARQGLKVDFDPTTDTVAVSMGGDKRGRESFLDTEESFSVEDVACRVVHDLLRVRSPTMC
ncbi:MAG: hypothetical protein FJ247_09740 [Nitrospira sp.]|nr:hypothetical protein [Nitrospira sp.]